MLPFKLSGENLFHSTKTTRIIFLVIFVPFLALGLFYQIWPLHAHVLAHTELEDVNSAIEARLNQLALVYKEQAVFNAHHLGLGPSVRLINYTARLDKASRDAFTSAISGRPLQKLQDVISTARSAVDLTSKTAWTTHDIPHNITTSIQDITKMPTEFRGWKQHNPDWAIQRFDERAMDNWLKSNLAAHTDSGLVSTVILETYNRLPRRILKSDMFRYLRIFLRGGLYADPDTSCVVPIAEWGQRGTTKDKTDFGLLQLAAEAHDLTHNNGSSSPFTPVNQASPNVIVAIETEITRDDHEGGHLAQYAFASAPGHPIFLDLLQQIVEVSRAMEDLRLAGDLRHWHSDQAVFTWTGAEIWSSAVWRYLWARWGFDSRRLHRVNHPVRVGDVLILPFEAFRASSADPSRQESAEACLWHGFHSH
ncbi:MAG: hypothetical protein Q9209_005743 [Squamulea sp. 1 TL-2023]